VTIDIHNHVFFPSDTPYTLDPELLVGSGVFERVCLLSLGSIWTEYTEDTDREVLRLAKEYDGFFVPFAYLDFAKSPECVEEFHRKGHAGLKAIFPPFPYDDERGWWGQFTDRRGELHRANAEHLRRTGNFRYPFLRCSCTVAELRAHLE